MREETTTGTPSDETALDPAQASYLRQQLESEQSLVLGAAAGAVVSLVGAAVWAGITYATGFQIGFMAIGVGLLVGYAVRVAGQGVTSLFGIVGGALALVGCGVGNLLAVTALVASSEGVPLLEVLPRLDLQSARELMIASFQPMDLLFYGIAVYEGYRFSFRELSSEELERKLSGGAKL